MNSVLDADLAFRDKVERLITVFMEETTEYPYVGAFMMKVDYQNFGGYGNDGFPGRRERFALLLEEIQGQIDKGNIPPMQPMHFLLNVLSLTVYPLVAGPFFEVLFSAKEAAVQLSIQDRRNQIMQLMID
jgi:hypothetical protein